MQKDLPDEGGNIPEKLTISYMLYNRNSVLTHNYQSVLAECEKHFLGVNLRAKPAVFPRGKYHFVCNFYFSHFSGQFLTKSVRAPYNTTDLTICDYAQKFGYELYQKQL